MIIEISRSLYIVCIIHHPDNPGVLQLEKKGKKVYGKGSKGMREQVGDKSTYSTLCHSMAYVMTEFKGT